MLKQLRPMRMNHQRALSCTRLTASADEAERLREALKPFAREAAGWDAEPNAGEIFHDHEPLEMEHRLTVGDLRRARTALTGATDHGG